MNNFFIPSGLLNNEYVLFISILSSLISIIRASKDANINFNISLKDILNYFGVCSEVPNLFVLNKYSRYPISTELLVANFLINNMGDKLLLNFGAKFQR